MKNQTLTKPEAVARIMDGLEEKGLYTPAPLLNLDEYCKLHARAVQFAVDGNLKRAEHLRGIMNRHAPDFILKHV